MTMLRPAMSIVAFVFVCFPTSRVIGSLIPRTPPPKPLTIAKPAGGPACPDPAGLYEQCPNFGDNGAEAGRFAYSDLDVDLSVVDNFSLQSKATIRRIRWWGTYLLFGTDVGGFGPGDDDFTVLVWGNASGNPSGGDPVSIPGYTVTRAMEPVGEILNGLGPDPVYEYDLIFEGDGFSVEPSVIYWLEVNNDTPTTAGSWVWVTAPKAPGDGSSRQRAPTTDPDWSAPTARGFDLAFALLSGPPEPIPCASQWGLIALALLLLAAGTIVLRHPRLPLSRGEGS